MRLVDLSPPQKRLLKLAGRIEPNAFQFVQGEQQAIDALVEQGLLEQKNWGVRMVAISPAGRKMLNAS